MTTEQQPHTNNLSGYKALLALGLANLGWSLFQWVELVDARKGGKPSCSFNATLDCGAVWDGNFASAVHDLTLIPVAGWGSIWALIAVLLPLFILRMALRTCVRPHDSLPLLALVPFLFWAARV